jgi:hypothetical protein
MLDEYGGDDSIQSLAKSYMTLQTRAAKNSLVEKSMMSGVKDIWFSTYINGLLSSPVTHAKNIVGNAAFGLYQIPERMVASLYSNYLPKAAREGELPKGLRWFGDLVPGSAEEKVGLDEALTMVQSLQNGMTEGLQLAATAFRNNQPNDLVSKIELQRGGRQDIGASLQDLAGQGPDTWLGKGLQYYGTAVTLPGRALLTEDEFFKGVFYRMEINTQITRRAKTVYRESVEAGMSEADALAEGVDAVSMADVPRQAAMSRRSDFAALWNGVHGPAAWDANPWVVALTFTVQRGNIDALAANETPPGAHQTGLMRTSEGQ